MFIHFTLIHNKPPVNVFLATSFDCKFEPKVKTLNKNAGNWNTVNRRMENSILSLKYIW